MAASHKGKDCLFSAISGTITLNGEPATDAHVKRIASKAHVEGEFNDETFTDSNGYFSMPAIWERNLLSRVFPMEFAVPQEIYVDYKGEEYLVWVSVKQKRSENSESRGKPLVVECELNSDKRLFEVDGSFFSVKCKWDVEEDVRPDYSNPANVRDNSSQI